MLVGLVAVIFSQMLPDFTGSTTDVFIGVAAVVVVNSGITLAAARRRWTIRSTALAFAARLRDEHRPGRSSPTRCWAATTPAWTATTRCSS